MNQSKQKLLEQFFSTTIKIRRIVDHMSNISLEDKVTTSLQLQALNYLKDHAKSTVGELAQELNMSSSSIAQFTDRLVHMDFVTRENDKNDRRIVRLVLAQNGEKELKIMHQKMTEKMNKFSKYISEEDLLEMVRIHTKILKNLEEK